MSECEFGFDDAGLGEEYEFSVGEDDAAVGADAVDAALGRRRRVALPGRRGVAVSAKKKPLWTYLVGVQSPVALTASAATTTCTIYCNTPYQVIDLMYFSAASIFNITSLNIGDTPMILGGGYISADAFAPSVQGRFVKFTTLQRGMTTQIGVTYTGASTTGVYFNAGLKVRSYWRG